MTKYIQDSMQKLVLQDFKRTVPSFKRCFRKDITKNFFENLHRRIHGSMPSHVVLSIYGEQGTFKSSVAQEIAYKLNPNISAKNIVFLNSQIEEIMPSIQPKQFVIRDERPKEFGTGSGRLEKHIEEYTEMLRKAEINLAFIGVPFEAVDAAHYYLMTIGVSETYDSVLVGVQSTRTRNFLGYAKIPIRLNNPLWIAYEKRKDEFVRKLQGDDLQRHDYDLLARRVMLHKEFDAARTKAERTLIVEMMFPRWTGGEKANVLARVEMLRRQEKL